VINEVQTDIRHLAGWRFGREDASLDPILKRLDAIKNSGISGQDMLDLLKAATDYGQLSSQEWQTIGRWAKEHYAQLSPEAQQMFTKLDETIQRKGMFALIDGSGVLAGDELDRVMAQIEGLASPAAAPPPGSPPAPTAERTAASSAPATPPPPAAPAEIPSGGDDSANREISLLAGKTIITGDRLLEAIRKGTADLDSQAAGAEFDAFAGFIEPNLGRLTNSAKEVMAVYQEYAARAKADGQSGIAPDLWEQMIADMEAVADGGTSVNRANQSAYDLLMRSPLANDPELAELRGRLEAEAPPKPAAGKKASPNTEESGAATTKSGGKPKAEAEAETETETETKTKTKTDSVTEPKTKAPSASAGKAGAGTVQDMMFDKAGEVGAQMDKLRNQISTLDPNSKTYHRDLLGLQHSMERAKEMMTLISNMMKALHEMAMSPINNIRA
jgi:hypothetical protein